MEHPFGDTFRQEVAMRCAAFSRLPSNDAALGLKRAAVAVTLVETDDGEGETALLLTRRAASLRAHGGQWALPGGRIDENETCIGAALRELDEELGLKLGDSDVLGILDNYPTRSGYLITPVVLWAGDAPQIYPNPKEVASVHRIHLREITGPDVASFISIPESDRQVIRLHLNGSNIHAPTAAVIYQFREVLAGRNTRVDNLEQPVFAWK
jgi:8-oxo-dGTP pyrophosphatase MutT (NUDIX family)